MSTISPEQMAEIYFNRKRFAAIPEIRGIIDYHHKGSATVQYWRKVLNIIGSKGRF